MAITNDSSSPGGFAGTYSFPTCTYASPSFSPPAGSLILFSVPANPNNTGGNSTFSTPTNTGTALTWNLLASQLATGGAGGVAVFWAYNASAQSGIVVTATVTDTATGVSEVGNACIDVWNGTAGNFTGAALVQNSQTTSPGNVAITTTAAGSQVAGAFNVLFPYAIPCTTTDMGEGAYGTSYGNAGIYAYKSAPIASPSATYINFVQPTGLDYCSYIVYEILAGAAPGPTVPAGGGVFVEC